MNIMRCNEQELFALASQKSQNFDREGVLILKERQDSFFRRSEGCSVRWFRLRGNLLFYLKGPEPCFEPLGLIVLGNHQVTVQTQDDNGHWPFQLVWENGVCYRLATFLETERTLWLKAMKSAAFNFVTDRISDLNQQLNDTRTTIDLRKYRTMNKIINDFNEVPFCEVSLSCENLLCDANDTPPSPFAAVYVILPEQDLCVRYCSTEILEKCKDPIFSRTIMFRASDGISNTALVRFVVYNICETSTQSGASMGSVCMRLNNIQWVYHRRNLSLPSKLGLNLMGTYPLYATLLRQNFVNPHQVTYRFRSGLGGDITVYEAIAEPRFCFSIPLQLVEIYMKREKEQTETMLAFAEIAKRMPSCHYELVNTHFSVMRLLESAKKAQDHANRHFAILRLYKLAKLGMIMHREQYNLSAPPEETNLAFVPVNLHLQRMWVSSDSLDKSGFHDVVTVGAFSAHSHHADKPGGLIRLVQQFKNVFSNKAEMMANTNRLDAEFDKIRFMKDLREESIAHMNKTLLCLQASRFPEAKLASEDIRTTVKKFLELWNVDACEEALTRIGWDKQRIDREYHALRIADELVMKARRAAVVDNAVIASVPVGAAGASAPEGAAGAAGGCVSPLTPRAAGVFTQEGATVVLSPNMAAGVFSLDGAASVFSPEAAAGIFFPEGAPGLESALNASALANLSASMEPGAALNIKSALEAVLSTPDETESARVMLAAMSASGAPITSSEPLMSSSSSNSSGDTTPAELACDLPNNEPDMQTNITELQSQADQFASDHVDTSPRDDRSGPSGSAGPSRKKNGKNRKGKKGGWNNKSQSRGARPKVAVARPQPLERHSSVKADKKPEVKKPAPVEKVSFKNLINSRNAEKKKAKDLRDQRAQELSLNCAETTPEIRGYNRMFLVNIHSNAVDMLCNVLLKLSDINTKGSCTELDLEDSKALMTMLIEMMDDVYKWGRMSHSAMRIGTESAEWMLEYASLQIRRDVCFSQALTTVTAGLMSWLSTVPSELVLKVIMSGLGPLCGFEGLLSLYESEETMWGDMVVAIEDLHPVLFKLVKATSSTPTIPQVTGTRNALVVELPVSEALYATFENHEVNPTFTVTAVFFNIGINDKATVAEALGEHKPQEYSNSDNLERLQKYYLKYCKIFPSRPSMDTFRAPSRSKPLEEVMENLRTAVHRRCRKNVEVLHLAALATRLMRGVRFTSCKSAKDRTGMSVTLEQATILSSEYQLDGIDHKRALDTMRSEGCRRENAAKNIGLSKYAFNKKQVMSLPEEYRPPAGSYGATCT